MILSSLLVAAALSAGNAEFEKASVVGAAEIAVARLKAEAVSAPSVTGVLVRAMREDPNRFKSREDARKAGESVYRSAVGEDLRTKVDAALAELAGTRDPEELFGTNFVRSSRVLTDAEVGRLLAGPYTNAFACERHIACEEQAATLVAAVRPEMSTVDTDDEEAARKTLRANIAAQGGRVVFEENLDYVSQKIVDPILADAKREKRRQQDYVRRVRSEAHAPSALARDIAWKLGENVRERAAKTENAALRWDIFPSVTNRSLSSAVETRVLGRFAAKIEEAPLGFDEKAVRAVCSANPKVHRKAAESRAAVRAVASERLLVRAREATLADAEKGERTELAEYLQPRLSSSALQKPLEAKLTAELDPILVRVRAESVEREYKTLYPTLADRTWYPETDLADSVVARSDFMAAVRSWRKMPELKALDRTAALEETDACADGAVREAFELARAAVAGQTKTVDEVKPSVLGESIDRKNSFFSRTPDLKAIVKMLTEATENRWSEKKNAVLWNGTELPKNADEQHAELFPSVKKRIELVAKEILEEMQKPEPEKKPEEPPPEETPPEETPPEDPKLLYSIIVTREGERVSVKLEQGGSSVVSRETDAKLAPFRSAMKEVADKLGAEILKLQ